MEAQTKEQELKAPEKKDTLAQKAGKKSKRLIFGQYLTELSANWGIKPIEIAGLAFLILLNFYLLAPYFGKEDLVNVFSAPLIPLLSTLSSPIISYRVGVRFWLLIFIIFLPISFYLFIKEISNEKLIAFLSAFIVCLPVSPFLASRIDFGLLTQDGGHVASLTLAIISLLFLLRFLRVGTFKMAVSAALGIALVALTSPLGFFIFNFFALILTFSEMLLSNGRLKILRFITIFILAGGFLAFWYHPKFLYLIITSSQGEMLTKTLFNLLPPSFFILPVLFTFGFLLFENRPQLQPLFLAVFFTIGFGLLSLGAGMQLHTSSRFLTAFGISLSFFLAIIAQKIILFIRNSSWIKKYPLVDRFRKQFSYAAALFIAFLLINVYLKNSSKLRTIKNTQVLGIADVQKVGIWEKRKEAGGVMGGIGNLITLTSFSSILLIRRKISK